MDGAQDEGFEAVIPRCDASELLEIAERVLDNMAPEIDGEVTGDGVLTIRFQRDDGLGFRFAEQFTLTIVVEPRIGQQPSMSMPSIRSGAAMLSWRKQNEAGKVSERIDGATILVVSPPCASVLWPDGKPPFCPHALLQRDNQDETKRQSG
nr:hypothetical protein [Rhizobium leguminosarum]